MFISKLINIYHLAKHRSHLGKTVIHQHLNEEGNIARLAEVSIKAIFSPKLSHFGGNLWWYSCLYTWIFNLLRLKFETYWKVWKMGQMVGKSPIEEDVSRELQRSVANLNWEKRIISNANRYIICNYGNTKSLANKCLLWC